MNLYDFVVKQEEIQRKVYPDSQSPTYTHSTALLLEDIEDLLDLEDLLQQTFNGEIIVHMQETWINVAFLGLAAAYRLGADKAKFQQAIQNILDMEPK